MYMQWFEKRKDLKWKLTQYIDEYYETHGRLPHIDCIHEMFGDIYQYQIDKAEIMDILRFHGLPKERIGEMYE